MGRRQSNRIRDRQRRATETGKHNLKKTKVNFKISNQTHLHHIRIKCNYFYTNNITK